MHVRALSIISCIVASITGGMAFGAGRSSDQATVVVRSFQRNQLTNEYWAEGAAIADIDRDGRADIVSGPFWYAGPDFKRRHKIAPATPGVEVSPLGQKSTYSYIFFSFTHDFNGDGWVDVLTTGYPGKQAFWYENPKKEAARNGQNWIRHDVFDVVSGESPALVDLLGSGRPVLLCLSGKDLGYLTPDPRNPRQKWTFHRISTPTIVHELEQVTGWVAKPGVPRTDFRPFVHGLGVGDVNQDGRQDVLDQQGWWEQPASVGMGTWRFHAWTFLKHRPALSEKDVKSSDEAVERYRKFYNWPFAISGAQMYAEDVNGDGRSDLVTSLNAHRHGLGWFEQVSDDEFEPHLLMAAEPTPNKYGVQFSQPHALSFVDVDNDGLKDIVTGMSLFRNRVPNPDFHSEDAAVIYWFRCVRDGNGTVEFVPNPIDADVGVGRRIAAADLNSDGLVDIVIANKKGTFVFTQQIDRSARP